MNFKDLECYECIYKDNCPVGYSKNNAACLTTRKPNEAAILYNIIDKLLSRKEKLQDINSDN